MFYIFVAFDYPLCVCVCVVSGRHPDGRKSWILWVLGHVHVYLADALLLWHPAYARGKTFTLGTLCRGLRFLNVYCLNIFEICLLLPPLLIIRYQRFLHS